MSALRYSFDKGIYGYTSPPNFLLQKMPDPLQIAIPAALGKPIRFIAYKAMIRTFSQPAQQRGVKPLLLSMLLLICAGCSDANGTMHGGATDNAGYAHVKVGMPF
jgi:hypothetical protein